MISQGVIDIYAVPADFDVSIDMLKLVFCTDVGDLPTRYDYGTRLLLSFDFAPLLKWKVYKAVANQKTTFDADEFTIDVESPYALAVGAASKDGRLDDALSDGTIVLFPATPTPSNPSNYDIWERNSVDVAIGDLSAGDAEAFLATGTDKVYFYWLDGVWNLCSATMIASIKNSVSTKHVKSQASVWNTVNVGTAKYINGWQSIIEYQGLNPVRNDFAIIADNFYIGAVGNIVQNGVDASGQPIYESTGEAYKPFSIDTVNHKIKFDGVVDFTNTNSFGTTTIDGGKITANTITSSQLTTGIALINGEVKSSDFTAIGGAGFRLKSGAAGTSADPTIYGAYIRGGVLEGTTLTGQIIDANSIRVHNGVYPSNTSPIVISKFIDIVGYTERVSEIITFYSPSYGVGYLADRITRNDAGVRITTHGTNSDHVEMSIDGGAWTQIITIGLQALYYNTAAFSSTKRFRVTSTAGGTSFVSAQAFFDVINSV